MSGDIFDGHSWGEMNAIGIQWMMARLLPHLPCTGQSPTQKYLSPKVNRAETEGLAVPQATRGQGAVGVGRGAACLLEKSSLTPTRTTSANVLVPRGQ